MPERASTWAMAPMASLSTLRSRVAAAELVAPLAKEKPAPQVLKAARGWINAIRSFVRTTYSDKGECGKPPLRYVRWPFSEIAGGGSWVCGMVQLVRKLTWDCIVQRGMLAQLSARLRARQAAAGGAGDGGHGEGEGIPVMIDDNCEVSVWVY